MILYLLMIIISMFLIAAGNILFNFSAFNFNTLDVVYIVTLCTGFVYLVDLVVSAIVMILPKKLFNPFSKFYVPFKFEKKFYLKIGIKKWKDKIPIGKGPLFIGFEKNKVKQMDNNKYVFEFMTQSCVAEVMHMFSALVGFVAVVFVFRKHLLNVGLAVAFVNFVLQLLPYFVQRYNRPKLMVLYKRNQQKQLRTAETEESECKVTV